MRKIFSLTILLLCLLVTFTVTYSLISRWSSRESRKEFVTVTDALNRVVQLKLPIKRVVVTGKGSWPIITVAYMFPNAKNVLYGLSGEVDCPLFRMVDPGIKSKIIPTIGVTPNVEEVAAMNPDVVVLKSTMKLTVGDSLEGLGIKVVYVDFENLNSYVRDVRVLGRIFNDEEKAEKIVKYYNETYNTVFSKSLTVKERRKVLFLYYSAKGGVVSFQAPGEGWLQTFMIEAAGGYALSRELAGTGWNTVSFEQIARWNPDIIFLVTYSDSPSAVDVKNVLLRSPEWMKINAVINGEVYAVPHDCGNIGALGSWDCPGSRWALGLEWMARKINPSLYSDLDVIVDAKNFYMEMYGLEEKDAVMIVNGISGDLI
jgi:iron complex transport system substrate-binding protein